MIRTNRKLLRQIQIVGLWVFVAGCQTGIVAEKATVPVTAPKSTLETTIENAFPGFTPSRSNQSEVMSNARKSSDHVKADFNGDGLVDEALLLSKANEWKLAVLFQQSTGDYAVNEITTFPGKDSDWKAIPIQKIHLYPVAAKELVADQLGFEVVGMPDKLEYSWQEQSRHFAAIRIRESAPLENQREADTVDNSVVTLVAQEPESEQELASSVDIDNQTIGDKPGADLLFTSGAGTMRFYTLNPLGKTKAMAFGKSAPGYDDCRTQQNAMSDGSLPEIELGMHFCIKTDEENIGYVWVEGLDLDVHSITLGYHVWVSDH